VHLTGDVFGDDPSVQAPSRGRDELTQRGVLEQMREGLAKIESGATDAQSRLDRYADKGDQLKQGEATATSPDRAVTVVAGPGGSVRPSN
jgi:hypothetical protein